MTIDEAIKHAEEVAEEHERHLKVYENMDEDRPLFREEENECKDCAEEHRQLAGWLKELKQLREQEPCEDAVSRKAVLNQIFYSTDNSGDVVLGSDLRKRIEKLPPVTPTRKKGKWVIKASGFPPEPMTVCSECGFDKDFYIRKLTYDKLKHCPICGAEMESEE